MRPVVIGLAGGLAGPVPVASDLRNLLFGIAPGDCLARERRAPFAADRDPGVLSAGTPCVTIRSNDRASS